MIEFKKSNNLHKVIKMKVLFKRIILVIILVSLTICGLAFSGYINTNKLLQSLSFANIKEALFVGSNNYSLTHNKSQDVSDDNTSPDDLNQTISDNSTSPDATKSPPSDNNSPQDGVNSTNITSSITIDENSQQDTNAKQNTTTTSNNLSLLKKSLQKYITNYSGTYGIYYYNLLTKEEFGITEEEQFVAASTVKIPINLYLYKKISEGANPKGLMPYLKEDYETGTGIIQTEQIGNRYTLEELSRLSIVYSDNVATNILLRYLGKWNVKEYMSQAGGLIINDFKNVSCPKDMGLYMKILYDFFLNNKVYGKQLMKSFLNTKFNDRLPALLPKSVKVAHKIGSMPNVTNDIGIVFTKEPYIISVMSKNIKEAESSKVIAEISKKVYVSVTSTTR